MLVVLSFNIFLLSLCAWQGVEADEDRDALIIEIFPKPSSKKLVESTTSKNDVSKTSKKVQEMILTLSYVLLKNAFISPIKWKEIFIEVFECFSGKDAFGKTGKRSTILKKVPLDIVEFKKCESDSQKSRLGSTFCLDEAFVSAGVIESIDTCELGSYS